MQIGQFLVESISRKKISENECPYLSAIAYIQRCRCLFCGRLLLHITVLPYIGSVNIAHPTTQYWFITSTDNRRRTKQTHFPHFQQTQRLSSSFGLFFKACRKPESTK
jgi:hypothetical protein